MCSQLRCFTTGPRHFSRGGDPPDPPCGGFAPTPPWWVQGLEYGGPCRGYGTGALQGFGLCLVPGSVAVIYLGVPLLLNGWPAPGQGRFRLLRCLALGDLVTLGYGVLGVPVPGVSSLELWRARALSSRVSGSVVISRHDVFGGLCVALVPGDPLLPRLRRAQRLALLPVLGGLVRPHRPNTRALAIDPVPGDLVPRHGVLGLCVAPVPGDPFLSRLRRVQWLAYCSRYWGISYGLTVQMHTRSPLIPVPGDLVPHHGVLGGLRTALPYLGPLLRSGRSRWADRAGRHGLGDR